MSNTNQEKREEKLQIDIANILRMKPTYVKPGLKQEDIERIEVIHKTDELIKLFRPLLQQVGAKKKIEQYRKLRPEMFLSHGLASVSPTPEYLRVESVIELISQAKAEERKRCLELVKDDRGIYYAGEFREELIKDILSIDTATKAVESLSNNKRG